MDFLNAFHQAVLVLLTLLMGRTDSAKCPRDWAKIARSVIKEEVLYQVYSGLDLHMPPTCPLNTSTDVYGLEEDTKRMDAHNQWTCRACGKTFYEDRYLELHFRNRHPHLLRMDGDGPCLADYCDILRCNVYQMYFEPAYWSQALCRDEDFEKRMEKCQLVLRQCYPGDAADEELFSQFNASFHEQVCQYLTCDTYWLMPDHLRVATAKSTLYLLSFIIVSIGLLVYYYLLIAAWQEEAEFSKQPVQSRDDSSDFDESVLDAYYLMQHKVKRRHRRSIRARNRQREYR